MVGDDSDTGGALHECRFPYPSRKARFAMIASTHVSLLFSSVVACAPLLLVATATAQVAYVDARGREWFQTAAIKNKTWLQVQEVCPTDGVTPCEGILGGVDITGCVWATKDEVQELFAEFVPEMARVESIGGPGYVLPGLFFFGEFTPTWEFYTTFGGYNYMNGWTSTESDGMASAPEVSAEYPVFYGSFNVAALVDVSVPSAFRGVWLYKAPDVFCTSDLDGDGAVDAADLAIVLGAWGSGAGSAADLDGDGAVDAQDLAVLLGAWGDC